MFFRPVFCIVIIQDSLAFHPYQLGYQATCISYFFSLPKFAQKISHFRTFCLGPPFAFWPKTAVFEPFGKIAISRLIDVFPPRFLHSQNLGQFSFPSIPIRLLGDLYFLFFQPSEVCPKNQPFLNILPWSPLCILAKNRGFRYLGKNCHFSSNRCFSARFFCMVKIQDSLAFHPYQLGYQATCISYFFSLPKFAQKISHFRTFSLGLPFAFWPKTAVFDTLGKIAISRLIDVFPPGFLHSQNLGQFSFPSIPIRLLGDLYFLFFQPSEVCPKNQPFSNILPWSPLCILAKNRGFRYLGKNCHFSSNRCFSARFFCIVKIQDSLAFHPYQLGYQATCISYFFSLPKFAQKISHFRTFSLGPPFAFWPKTAVFDTLGKIAISRLIDVFSPGFLHSQNLGQFSFPSIPIRLLGDFYFLFFQPSEVCPRNQPFSNIFPWPPLCIVSKNRSFRYLGKNCHFSSNRCFSARFFAYLRCRIVQLSIHTNQAIRRLLFPIFLAFRSLPKKSAIFEHFPLAPPLHSFQKPKFSIPWEKLPFLV